jgi:FtsP/CotA-like multicopper oxidase with cupredoxin domain
MTGPIAPNCSFTYRFRATSYGNTWYHSHFSLQYPDGILGSIVVHGPSSANWDIDLGPVAITDWFHTPASELWFTERLPGLPIPADTGLVNGKNVWNLTGEYTNLTFTPGKKHRIRLVNTSTNTHFKFWIDEHVMTVMAADFIPIQPYNTTVLNINIGSESLKLSSNFRPTIRYCYRCRSSERQLLVALPTFYSMFLEQQREWHLGDS